MSHLYIADRRARDGQWEEAEALYNGIAEAGDPRGWLAIARHYCEEVHLDLPRALELFERAAALGNDDGAFQAAFMWWRGSAGDADPEKALRYFELASASGGGSIAATRAGWLLYSGEVGAIDAPRAIELFRRAVTIDDEPEAMLGLGYAYSEGKIERDPAEAAHWFRRATYESEGLRDRAATESRREMFSRWAKEGIAGVHRLLPELQELAERDDGAACFELSEAMEGRFAPGELEDGEVLRWLERAAELGHPRACLRLAHRYRTGRGVDVDPARARALFAKAADANVGNHDYAYALRTGLGGDVDPDLAIEHYRRAAARGGRASKKDLAISLDERGAEGDAEECTRWLLEAAADGDVGAMLWVASRLRDGVGTDVDLVEATRWFLRPLKYGNGDGIHEIHQYCRRMTAEELHEADRRAGHDGSWASSLIASFRSSD